MPENTAEISESTPGRFAAIANSFEGTAYPARWLCPIQSESEQRGILQMTAGEYFDLVDKSGRLMRLDKRGIMDADPAPILSRIGVNPQAALGNRIKDFSETMACKCRAKFI